MPRVADVGILAKALGSVSPGNRIRRVIRVTPPFHVRY